MQASDTILGLFFADENNLVFEKLKLEGSMPEEKLNSLKTLSFKFLGPIFLTAASNVEEKWKITFIESSLSLHQELTSESGGIQSFFNLNSPIETPRGMTNLFSIIGSPYTEDVHKIYARMTDYIHPSILQRRLFDQGTLGTDYKPEKAINEELERGRRLIEYALGSSRKMYWKKQQTYACAGLLQRTTKNGKSTTELYTFEANSQERRTSLEMIPSYYVMTVLPDYYDDLVDGTLSLFDKKGIISTIRQIKLFHDDKKVNYVEEHALMDGTKKSYGVILIPSRNEDHDDHAHNVAYYKKHLRQLLDNGNRLKDVLMNFNPDFSTKKWTSSTDAELNDIRQHLDQNKN